MLVKVNSIIPHNINFSTIAIYLCWLVNQKRYILPITVYHWHIMKIYSFKMLPSHKLEFTAARKRTPSSCDLLFETPVVISPKSTSWKKNSAPSTTWLGTNWKLKLYECKYRIWLRHLQSSTPTARLYKLMRNTGISPKLRSYTVSSLTDKSWDKHP